MIIWNLVRIISLEYMKKIENIQLNIRKNVLNILF